MEIKSILTYVVSYIAMIYVSGKALDIKRGSFFCLKDAFVLSNVILFSANYQIIAEINLQIFDNPFRIVI